MRRGRWECEGYLKWVKSLPCVLYDAPADDPHHLIGLGGMGGTGTKAPDWAVMPVTRAAHNEIHRSRGMQEHQWEWIARTLGRAIDEGVLIFNPEHSGQR